MRFEFSTAGRILFGAGTVSEVPAAARQMGSHALLVTGQDPERAVPLVARLHAEGLSCTTFLVAGEPTIEAVERGVRQAREAGCDVVIGFGGGSAIDAGKAIAALLGNDGELMDYLEVIGRGQALSKPSVPFIAIPTTAGTGSEVTRNAVLASPQQRVKASLRSPHMLPRLAIVDPELTLDLPPAITASTGLDALTQLIEPFVSPRANVLTDLYCREGLQRCARSLRTAWKDGHDLAAREDMALASLLGGLSLANAGLGAVHGFAAPIGGMFNAPHGAVCAALLPWVTKVNLRAMRIRDGSTAVGRYEIVARLLGETSFALAEDAVEMIQGLCNEMGIPPLRSYGVQESDFPEIADKAAEASSMKGNPISLTREEMLEILASAH